MQLSRAAGLPSVRPKVDQLMRKLRQGMVAAVGSEVFAGQQLCGTASDSRSARTEPRCASPAPIPPARADRRPHGWGSVIANSGLDDRQTSFDPPHWPIGRDVLRADLIACQNPIFFARIALCEISAHRPDALSTAYKAIRA